MDRDLAHESERACGHQSHSQSGERAGPDTDSDCSEVRRPGVRVGKDSLDPRRQHLPMAHRLLRLIGRHHCVTVLESDSDVRRGGVEGEQHVPSLGGDGSHGCAGTWQHIDVARVHRLGRSGRSAGRRCWLEGDATWEVVDRMSAKCIGGPHSREEERVVALVQPDRQSIG